MRRLISFLAAVALVAGPLATTGVALAKDHHDGGGGRPAQQRAPGGDGRMPGGARGVPPQVWHGGGEYRGGRDYPGGMEYRGGGQRWERQEAPREVRPDPRYYGGRAEPRAEPRFDPRSYPPMPYQSAPRRGGYLGPQGGEVIPDPGRYRLRPPPRGYDWVRTPSGMALVSRSTGQVFDVVPY
ncbi:MAG TPA: RcnB family protein [Phenylobacterium sp.]|jgi:Ni/Co efflux regulator RcnB